MDLTSYNLLFKFESRKLSNTNDICSKKLFLRIHVDSLQNSNSEKMVLNCYCTSAKMIFFSDISIALLQKALFEASNIETTE